MGDSYDARNYMFTIYYDQQEDVWVAEAEGTYMNADHPASHLAALAELEHKLSARCNGLPTSCATPPRCDAPAAGTRAALEEV